MSVFPVNDHILAFYEGRPAEKDVAPGTRDWAAYGAFNVGVCTYVIHRGDSALVYDTFPDVRDARWVRDYLARMGITHFTLVNSHWHLDHVGGNEAYADVDRIATERTIGILERKRAPIEAGTEWGPPAVKPLVVPNVGIAQRSHVHVGDIDVELRPVNIHSEDGLVIFIPGDRLLLAGDTLEDSLTFITEPENIGEHAKNLADMKAWGISRILPNHGNPAVISSGGYAPTLIDATLDYLRRLTSRVGSPGFLDGSLESYVDDSVARGWVSIWWAYREAHAENLHRVHEAYKDRVPPNLQ